LKQGFGQQSADKDKEDKEKAKRAESQAVAQFRQKAGLKKERHPYPWASKTNTGRQKTAPKDRKRLS
jgi:hypothetical protein